MQTKNDDLACEVLYGKGLVYKYNLKDFPKAIEVFKLVVSKYPDNRTARSAMAELKDMGHKINSNSNEETTAFSMETSPNPFNPSTRIQFVIPEASFVKVEIYNVLGQKVAVLVERDMPAGSFTEMWDGRNEFGRKVSAGLYFCSIQAGSFAKTIKMTLLP